MSYQDYISGKLVPKEQAVVSSDGGKIGTVEPGLIAKDLLERFHRLTRS